MRKFSILAFIFTFYILHFTFSPPPVYAACVDPKIGVTIKDCFGFGDITSIGQGVDRLIRPIFSVAAAIVILYFLFGALKFLTSAGDKETMAAGRQMITHAIIGFVLLIFVFIIMQFLLSQLFGITSFLVF